MSEDDLESDKFLERLDEDAIESASDEYRFGVLSLEEFGSIPDSIPSGFSPILLLNTHFR